MQEKGGDGHAEIHRFLVGRVARPHPAADRLRGRWWRGRWQGPGRCFCAGRLSAERSRLPTAVGSDSGDLGNARSEDCARAFTGRQKEGWLCKQE